MVRSVYKTAARRLFAAIIDSGAWLAILFALDFQLQKHLNLKTYKLWQIYSLQLFWMYSFFLHGLNGETLGKRIMKIKLIDFESRLSTSFGLAFRRELPFILVQFTIGVILYLKPGAPVTDVSYFILLLNATGAFWLVLELATMFTNKRRRAIQDYIGGTLVIRKYLKT